MNVTKRLRPRLAQDVRAKERLRVEAEILGALAGRGAPVLVSTGESWLTMHAAPPTLQARMRTYIHLPWLANAAKAAFGALAAVHEAEDEDGPLAIVHGDVSPSNLAISDDASSALLLDFGLASGRRWPRTNDGAFRGTVRYAAPETARGEPIDVRADVFALAASLLHAASGLAPREAHGRAVGPAAFAALLASAAEEPVDAWAERASAPLAAAGFEPLAHALRLCVSFDRLSRPPSARAALVV